MEERIQEILQLIDAQLAVIPDNPIYENYKARTLANYVQTLNGLIMAQESLRRRLNE